MIDFEKNYNFNEAEEKIFKAWESDGGFNPDVCLEKGVCKKDADPFTIILPPPNITDKLHMGHTVMVAVSDILIRYNRMKGKKALWIPGTDHAAIATQNVVEKDLVEKENKTRHDLGKEEFLKRVWDFVYNTQSTIIKQIKKTGASLDWSREAFTLDEKRRKAVKQMFIDMYNEGVIYRGKRVINWCPKCQSTLADDELDYKENNTKLYTFKYSRDCPFDISTVRPETKLGDTAVAVNPGDERYKKYIGQTFKVDFLGTPLELKVIGDKGVDPDFGTGALGVTPAHSMNDYLMAVENDLDIKEVIGQDRKILDGFKEFSGKDVEEARELLVEKIRNNGLMEAEEDIINNLSVCYRCDTPIEPLPSKQWFVNVNKKLERLGNKSLKEKGLEVVEKGEIEFVPSRFGKQYKNWMENLHDWCISRQIWFGHEIPAWYKGEEIYVGNEEPGEEGWVKDGDVLDTWFSSGMWSFSTLGWPEDTEDLKTYHPTQVLETGHEIITLWVSRMIMMSFFTLEEIPFKYVYLHGMVLDEKGNKMSKSKRNGIDPVDMIEKYGADATRISLIIGNTPGNNIKMNEKNISACKSLVNKIWNIARYVSLEYKPEAKGELKDEELTLADFWILNKMKETVEAVSDDIDNFRFSIAADRLKDFTWNFLADWYLEISKFEKTDSKKLILNSILDDLMKLWHPFLPFVTEEIWRKRGNKNMLYISDWPQKENYNLEGSGKDFELVKQLISSIRSIRADYRINPGEKVDIILISPDNKDLIEKHTHLIKNLRTNVDKVEFRERGQGPEKDFAYKTIEGMELYIPLGEVIDIEKERKRLQEEKDFIENNVKNIEKKLKDENFLNKAPKDIVDSEKEKREKRKQEAERLAEIIDNLR